MLRDLPIANLSIESITIVGVVLGVFAILGVLSALRAVMTTRTPQGAVAWVGFLLTLPIVSVPLYWVFGRSSFHGPAGWRPPAGPGPDAATTLL